MTRPALCSERGAKLEGLESERLSTRTENDRLSRLCQSHETTLKDLNEKLESASNLKASLDEKLEVSKVSHQKVSEELESVKRETDRLAGLCQEKEENIEKLKKELQSMSYSKEGLEEDIARCAHNHNFHFLLSFKANQRLGIIRIKGKASCKRLGGSKLMNVCSEVSSRVRGQRNRDIYS